MIKYPIKFSGLWEDPNSTTLNLFYFYKNDELTEIIDENVTHISLKNENQTNIDVVTIFNGCYLLLKLDLGLNDTITSFNNCFINCINLEEIILPKNLLYFYGSGGGGCFSGCKKLTKLILPEKFVGFLDFVNLSYCNNLKTIILPETFKECHYTTFLGSNNINEIYVVSDDDFVIYKIKNLIPEKFINKIYKFIGNWIEKRQQTKLNESITYSTLAESILIKNEKKERISLNNMLPILLITNKIKY